MTGVLGNHILVQALAYSLEYVEVWTAFTNPYNPVEYLHGLDYDRRILEGGDSRVVAGLMTRLVQNNHSRYRRKSGDCECDSWNLLYH